MAEKARLLELSEREYLEIEEALAGTPRGRAFLRMRDQRTRAIAPLEVERLLRKLKADIEAAAAAGQQATHIDILRQELQEMSATIHQARSSIAALRPQDPSANRIMAATEELDAIVTAAERATSDILNAAERIQEAVNRLRKTTGEEDSASIAELDDIDAQCIDIFTACSFQDITGQRTTKVVNTLRYLEQRVNAMIEIWGVSAEAAGNGKETAAAKFLDDVGDLMDKRPDAHLLNGPALRGGVSQDDVDAMFTGPGSPAEPDDQEPADDRNDRKTAKPAPKAEAKPVPRKPAAKPKAASKASPEPAGDAIDQSDIDAMFD